MALLFVWGKTPLWELESHPLGLFLNSGQFGFEPRWLSPRNRAGHSQHGLQPALGGTLCAGVPEKAPEPEEGQRPFQDTQSCLVLELLVAERIAHAGGRQL